MLLDLQLNNYVHLFSAFQLSQLDLQCASLMRANLCGIDDVQSSVVERVRSQSTLLPTFRTLRIFYCAKSQIFSTGCRIEYHQGWEK